MFVKEQFYLIIKSLSEIDNQSEPQRNKEFIELLQQQNKNLVEENKSKTTIIQVFIENQNHLNKVYLESNSTKILKLSHENQTENKVSIKLMKLNVLIGMKHFIQMIMMMNLAIHTIVVPLKAAIPHLTKSYRVMYKRIKIEKYPQKGRK